jgi:hypothetical protein
MRIVSLFLLVACAGPGAVFVDPMNGPPIGVGLVQNYVVTQAYCSDDGDVDCPARPPMSLSVYASSDAVEVVASSESFELLGVKPGGASLTVTGDEDFDAVFTVTVENVRSTTLLVERQVTADKAFSNVESPVSAFVGSPIPIDQENISTKGEALAGKATLQLAPGSTAARVTDGTFETGFHTGTAQVSTDLAMMTVNVVDGDAIADFAIGDASSTELMVGLSVGTTKLWLLPQDASGHPIVGVGGPKPTVQIADPTIVTVAGTGSSGVVPSLVVESGTVGMTTMTITWGAVTKMFTVHVIASS